LSSPPDWPIRTSSCGWARSISPCSAPCTPASTGPPTHLRDPPIHRCLGQSSKDAVWPPCSAHLAGREYQVDLTPWRP
jgi:hypothetical protein